MAREELKVNIIVKEGKVFLGAQATDCDPKMTVFDGDLQTALERIPAFIEVANREWDTTPHNPKSTIPEPTPPKPAASTTTRAAAPKSKEPGQKAFF